MILESSIMVSYGQVLVFSSDLARPGLIWSAAHGAQGFAYAPGIVSFGVPDHDGQCLLQVDIVKDIVLLKQTLWAICVPFDVTSAPLMIGTVGQPKTIAFAPKKYEIVFEVLPRSVLRGKEYSYALRILFRQNNFADFSILKFGYGLSSNTILQTDAEYA